MDPRRSAWSPSSSSSSLSSASSSISQHQHRSDCALSPSPLSSHPSADPDDLEDTAFFKPSRALRKPRKKSRPRHLRHASSSSSSSSSSSVAAAAARRMLGRIHGCLPLLLLLFAIAWLILEVCHFSQDHPMLPRKIGGSFSSAGDQNTKKESNLDNLDMPTRIVAGVREPCLKLLTSDEIANLRLPSPSISPIRSLSYKNLSIGMDNSFGGFMSRRELFIGNQTMQEREESFKVSEVMEVHCGFCGDGNIFSMDQEDKVYLQSCEIAVLTCNFGGGDDIYQPINMTRLSLFKVCYVAFWDTITLEAQAEQGRKVGIDKKIGHWRIVVVGNLPFADQRLNGKIPKMLGHRLLVNARYSIWVDSKSQFRRDPIGVLEALLWRDKSTFAISEHGARDCLYKEAEAIVRKHKATPEEVAVQVEQYRMEGFPEKARIDGHKALAEASIIIREHTPLTNLFMCLWFNEVTRFTARDQLSFPYVLRRLSLLHIHMFPVCTRKALVNSLGHVRKAKPLSL